MYSVDKHKILTHKFSGEKTMSKYVPSMPMIVKGMIVTVLTLFVIRFLPAGIKARIVG